jgi:NDP-sugar pyrophosphorylase family protein
MAIMEHNLTIGFIWDWWFWISVKYLGEQIEAHFQGKEKNLKIEYVWKEPLELLVRSQIKILEHDYILTNSDLLTNIDYEQFFLEFIDQDADLAVYTVIR